VTPQAQDWMPVRAHAGQAFYARPAQQIDEHRLGLIISRVARQHPGGEYGEASAPGTGFQVRTRRNVNRF
jgi:hypothetical protein